MRRLVTCDSGPWRNQGDGAAGVVRLGCRIRGRLRNRLPHCPKQTGQTEKSGFLPRRQLTQASAPATISLVRLSLSYSSQGCQRRDFRIWTLLRTKSSASASPSRSPKSVLPQTLRAAVPSPTSRKLRVPARDACPATGRSKSFFAKWQSSAITRLLTLPFDLTGRAQCLSYRSDAAEFPASRRFLLTRQRFVP